MPSVTRHESVHSTTAISSDSWQPTPVAQFTFLNRLRSLQWLCSDTDPTCPRALLFIAGPDGCHNEGSTQVFRYLFGGGVGGELSEDSLGGSLEVLDELVLLIRADSVAVILTETMRARIGPLLQAVPCLVEYGYSAEETSDVELFQLRKALNFKKMILAEVTPVSNRSENEGVGIGMPVPRGYDEVIEVERWPLVQSFALDSLLCTSGFFTARHRVVDVTIALETLFRAVDGAVVDAALRVVEHSVVVHVKQLCQEMDLPTVSQREMLTADDIVGPLDILFEFGELDMTTPLDTTLRPSVLFGPWSSYVGQSESAIGWRKETVSHHELMVIEGCEPASGMRFARTYFVGTGAGGPLVEVGKEVQRALGGSTQESTSSKGDLIDTKVFDAAALGSESISHARLIKLYAKLCASLRTVVHEVFLEVSDVLETASAIQTRLQSAMSSSGSGIGSYVSNSETDVKDNLFNGLDSVSLAPSETLQIHVDCMDSNGSIITVEDVDDLGGACWVYIRAAINGVRLRGNGCGGGVVHTGTGALAVGDTFLFSPLARMSKSGSRQSHPSLVAAAMTWRLQDAVCATAAVSYMQFFLGGGIEESVSRLIGYVTKTADAAESLGLGKPISTNRSSGYGHQSLSSSTLPFFTSHPLLSVASAEVEYFTGGFVVRKINGLRSVPVVVSFANDVDAVWTVDHGEALEAALDGPLAPLQPSRHRLLPVDLPTIPGGFLFVMRLRRAADGSTIISRTFPDMSSHRTSGVTSISSGSNSPIHGDDMGDVWSRYIVFSVGDEETNEVTTALESWKVSMRRSGIINHKGSDVVSQLPSCVLEAYVQWLDNVTGAEAQIGSDLARLTAETVMERVHDPRTDVSRGFLAFAEEYAASFGLPGVGKLSMRAMHLLADAQRVSSFDFQTLLFPPNSSKPVNAITWLPGVSGTTDKGGNGLPLQVALITGYIGGGIEIAGGKLAAAYHRILPVSSFEVVSVSINLAEGDSKDALTLMDRRLLNAADSLRLKTVSTSKTPVLIVRVVLTAARHIATGDLRTLITALISGRIVQHTVIVSPATLHYIPKESDNHSIGRENYISAISEQLHVSTADFVLAVEAVTGSSESYGRLRRRLSSVNPSARLQKVLPTSANLLSDEDYEYLVSRFKTPNKSQGGVVSLYSSFLTESESALMLRGYPAPYLTAKLGGESALLDCNPNCFPTRTDVNAVLRCRVISLPAPHKSELHAAGGGSMGGASTGRFSLASLLTLLGTLFPAARAGQTTAHLQWNSSAVRPSQSIHGRLMQTAIAKSFSKEHGRQLSAHFQETLMNVLKRESSSILAAKLSAKGSFSRPVVLTAEQLKVEQKTSEQQWLAELQRGLCGMRALLVIQNEAVATAGHNVSKHLVSGNSRRLLIVEANHSFVAVREATSEDESIMDSHRCASASQDAITIEGILTSVQWDSLSELLSACEALTMRKAASISAADYSSEDLRNLQFTEQVASRPLPVGWWYDGSGFIDHHGTRHELRPDIAEIRDEDILRRNSRLQRFNELVDDMGY